MRRFPVSLYFSDINPAIIGPKTRFSVLVCSPEWILPLLESVDVAFFIITPLAEKYLVEGYLFESEMETVHHLVPKYWRQWV